MDDDFQAAMAKGARAGKTLEERQILALEQIADQSGLIRGQLQNLNLTMSHIAARLDKKA
jgi:hypothetical protein